MKNLPVAKAITRFRSLPHVVVVAVLATLYLVAGKLGLMLAFVHASVTAVWPPTGIVLTAFLVWGSCVWPGAFVGAFLVNVTTAGSVATSLAIAAGNTLEGLAGAHLVNRFAGGRHAFERPRDIFKFALLAGAVSTMVSATVGATSLSLGGFADWADYGAIWLTWWLGDMVGAILVAPPLVLWATNPRVRWQRAQAIEAACLLLCLFLVGQVVFGGWFPLRDRHYPLAYLCMPILAWAGFRFGQRETATVTALLSVMALWGTLHGFGPFPIGMQHEALLWVQTFLAVSALLGLVFAAVVSEHGQVEALRQRELQTRLIVDNAYDAFVAMDERGTITEWNPQAEKVFGWPRDQALGRAMAETIIPQRYREEHRRGLQHFLATGEGPVLNRRIEITALRRDGTEFPVELSIRPLNFGGAWTFHAFIADITDRKRAEDALRRTEEQLRQAQRMEAMGKFAGRIARDFTKLIAVITRQSTLLMGSLRKDDRLHSKIEEIKSAADRAAALTHHLLAFSSSQVLRPRLLDLNTIVTGLRGMLQWLIGKDIELVTKLDPALGWVKADPGQIELIMMTLAGHARDAMDQRGTLTIETSNVKLETAVEHASGAILPGRYVMLAVRDTGGGMDQETQDRIFEPFFTTKETGQGTGLRLSTVYGIVQQSGGSISVHSAIGRGTVFKIYLPLA